jgi:hypothetical protein
MRTDGFHTAASPFHVCENRFSIYFSVSSSPEGLCVAAPREGGKGTDFFGVICQGINGKTCFWDQAADCANLPCFQWNSGGLVVPASPLIISSTTQASTDWIGGLALAGGGNGTCSDCHAGENGFANHPGTATDLVGRGLVSPSVWFPNEWPDPIVPYFDSSVATGETNGFLPDTLGGAWPQNPGPSTYSSSYSSDKCFTCHVQTGPGRRFPKISLQLPGYCTTDLYSATHRVAAPNCAGNIDCPSGAMAPAATMPPTAPSYNTDPFAEAMLGTNCNAAPSDSLADWQSPNWAGGGNDTGLLGYLYPQEDDLGYYNSVYGNRLTYTSNDTQLEATGSYFCWVTGFNIVTAGGSQPNPLPTMYLNAGAANWQLLGTNNTGSQISAQCAPWSTIFSSALTNYNSSRNWSSSKAMASLLQYDHVPPGTLGPLSGSTATDVCFISGVDGDFLSNGDSSQAAVTLWWPGETSPNTYSSSWNGSNWYVQVGNSATEQFANAHIICIDIGINGSFNNARNAGQIPGYSFGEGYYPYPMTNVDANACIYSQIVASGTAWGPVQTNENYLYDNATANFPNSWVIGDGFSDVVWLYEDCLSFR